MPKKSEDENTFKVKGEDLLAKVKGLIKAGNVRRIIIKNEKGEIYLEIPINVGIVGAVIAPVLVAIGALAAIATSFTIEIIKKEESFEKSCDGKKSAKK